MAQDAFHLHRSGVFDRAGQWHAATDRAYILFTQHTEKGLYGFNPTCFLGVYMPDAFWLDDTPESLNQKRKAVAKMTIFE